MQCLMGSLPLLASKLKKEHAGAPPLCLWGNPGGDWPSLVDFQEKIGPQAVNLLPPFRLKPVQQGDSGMDYDLEEQLLQQESEVIA